jgi:hypothetical protein
MHPERWFFAGKRRKSVISDEREFTTIKTGG